MKYLSTFGFRFSMEILFAKLEFLIAVTLFMLSLVCHLIINILFPEQRLIP